MKANAQSTERSGITGKVTDTSGAVVPGVTVTISSPSLPAGPQAAQTDTAGRYRFTTLPNGMYAIQFELSGFETVKRTNVRLEVGFIATIDAQLKVSAIQVSVTVSGASPVVDVKTTAVSTSLNKDALENLPTSRTIWQILDLAPGVRVSGTPDVGGSATGTQQDYGNYGTTSGGNTPTIDGVNTREVTTGAGFYYDYGAFEEVQIKAMGNDAEVSTPGTNFVGILKSGADVFHGTGFFAWETPSLQSDNVDNALRAQGITSGNPLKTYYDGNADLGGPILKNHAWFYGSFRDNQITTGLIGYYVSPGVPGEYNVNIKNYTGKITGQLNPKHRFSGFVQAQKKWYPQRTADAYHILSSTWNQNFKPIAGKGEWTWLKSNRTVIDAMVGHWGYDTALLPNSGDPSKYDVSTLQYFGSSTTAPADNGRGRWQYDGTISHFFTGGIGQHDLKAGAELTWENQFYNTFSRPNGNDYELEFKNGAPFQVVLSNAPFGGQNLMHTQSGFVRDLWNPTDRLTLNLGVRWDHYNVFLPTQSKPAGPFSQAGSFPELQILDWRAFAPRIGAAWALDAQKKTVVKGTWGVFNYATEPGYAAAFNQDAAATTTYRWNDLNGNLDYNPGELGAFVSATGAKNAILNTGLGQPRTYEATGSVERQIGPDFSARASYVYRRETNLYQTVNTGIPYSAYDIPISGTDPFTGSPITYYDYNAAYRGSAFVRNEDLNTPGYTNQYHNIEVAAQKRLSNRWQTVSSILATHTGAWLSEYGIASGTPTALGIPQTPNAANFFPEASYWDWTFKLSGSYQLPYDINVAGFLTSQSGTALARNALFTAGLHQLSQLILQMSPIGSIRLPAENLLNFRLEKVQRFSHRMKASFQFDVFNITNTNAALAETIRTGANFGRIIKIMPPRIVRLGVTFAF